MYNTVGLLLNFPVKKLFKEYNPCVFIIFLAWRASLKERISPLGTIFTSQLMSRKDPEFCIYFYAYVNAGPFRRIASLIFIGADRSGLNRSRWRGFAFTCYIPTPFYSQETQSHKGGKELPLSRRKKTSSSAGVMRDETAALLLFRQIGRLLEENRSDFCLVLVGFQQVLNLMIVGISWCAHHTHTHTYNKDDFRSHKGIWGNRFTENSVRERERECYLEKEKDRRNAIYFLLLVFYNNISSYFLSYAI